jgi:hypothetical protein
VDDLPIQKYAEHKPTIPPPIITILLPLQCFNIIISKLLETMLQGDHHHQLLWYSIIDAHPRILKRAIASFPARGWFLSQPCL